MNAVKQFLVGGWIATFAAVSGCATYQPASHGPTTTQTNHSDSIPVSELRRLGTGQSRGANAADATTSLSLSDNNNTQTSDVVPISYQGDDTEDPPPVASEIGSQTSIAPEILPPRELPADLVGDFGHGLTLDALEQMAIQNNPAIQQALAATCQAVGNRTQVGLKPNPTIGYFADEMGNDSSAGLHGVFVSQTFVRGGKLAWNRRVIDHDVRILQWQAEVQRFRIRNDIRQKFYDALAAQQRLHLTQQFRHVVEEGVEISEALLKGGEYTRADVLQAQLQLSEIDLAIRKAEVDFDAAWKELAAIAAEPSLAPIPLIGNFESYQGDRDFESAYAQLVADSPQVAAACAAVARARTHWERQRLQPISNVNAQLGVGYDDGTGDEFSNLQISMPIPVHNKNQGNIRAAYAQYCAATQNVKRLKLQIRQNLARAMRRLHVAQATASYYKTDILPKADETLDLVRKGQEAGEFDAFRVLVARRAYFDASLAHVNALADLAKASAQIDGLLLTGGLSNAVTYDERDELRSQSLNGQ